MTELDHNDLQKRLDKANRLSVEIENLRSRIRNINDSWSIGITAQGVACYNFKPDTACSIEVLNKEEMQEIYRLTVAKVIAPLQNKLHQLLNEYKEL